MNEQDEKACSLYMDLQKLVGYYADLMDRDHLRVADVLIKVAQERVRVAMNKIQDSETPSSTE